MKIFIRKKKAFELINYHNIIYGNSYFKIKWKFIYFVYDDPIEAIFLIKDKDKI